jgi:hypothetical protein
VTVGVVARVLVGPLDIQDRSFVIIETAHVVATSVVILRVKHSISIVPVTIRFIKAIVTTPGIVEVHVRFDVDNESYKPKDERQALHGTVDARVGDSSNLT